MADKEAEVEALIAPDLLEIADFVSFRYLKGANAGANELGRPCSLRKEQRVSPLVIFVVGQVQVSAWVELRVSRPA